MKYKINVDGYSFSQTPDPEGVEKSHAETYTDDKIEEVNGRIDREVSTVNRTIDSEVSAVESKVNTEIASLNSALELERIARQTTDEGIGNSLLNEVTARTNAVNNLESKVDKKVDKKEDFFMVKIWNTLEQVSLGKTNSYTWIEDEQGNVSSIPGQLSDFKNDMNYAVSSTTLSGYGITDAYTKVETNEYLAHKENVSNKVDVDAMDSDVYGEDEYATARSVATIWKAADEFVRQLFDIVAAHDDQIGDIETALDNIIAIQNGLIGGGTT